MEGSWILLGMMGAGKSSVGRKLAEATGREFLDTDALLSNKLGRTIPQLFQIYGESTFRDHETAVLRSLEPGKYVLATGGGIIGRDENWTELRRIGKTIYLSATPETLIERLEFARRKRPLLEHEDWQERLRTILSQRIPLYEQADIKVEVDGLDISDTLGRILKALNIEV